MMRNRQNRAGLIKESGFLILLLLGGCTSLSGMTEWDKMSQDEGLILHCTEVTGDTCLTHQWFNEVQTTYQRFHQEEQCPNKNPDQNPKQ